MKNFTALVLTLSLLFSLATGIYNKSFSQISMQDSLALIDLYNSTNGPGWFDNSGWATDDPISTWYGVILLDGVIWEIHLSANNLQGPVPSSVAGIGTLTTFLIRDNEITDLPAFPSIGSNGIMETFDCSLNFLEFDDIENTLGNGIGSFIYDPQKEYGTENFFTKQPGENITLDMPAGGSDNLYEWYKDGMLISGPSTDSALPLGPLSLSDAGDYVCQVTSTSVPFLVLNSKPQHLSVVACEDALGAPYACQQMIIRFKPGTTQGAKDSLRMEYGAEKIDSCLCDFLEVWDIPDSLGLEETVGLASKKADVEETGFNYIIDIGPAFDQYDPPAIPPPFTGNPPGPDNIGVAIIDSGVDWDHSLLFDRIWTNAPEIPVNGADDDGNCLDDDYQGYDFPNDSIHPIDLHGHGTHIAGIIADGTPLEVELINLKAFDIDGKGSVFDAACAVYYAIQKQAKVINMSWGYYGLPSPVLEAAIEEAALSCGALVVTSAGNISNDNDNNMHHYPSDFTLDNIVSVAALDQNLMQLASFSNFGMVSVDIAAPGTQIFSTLPGNSNGFRSGSSMAAGFVSKIAALMFNSTPGISYRGVKSCLFSTVATISGGLDSLTTGGQYVESDAMICAATDPNVYECQALLNLNIMLEGPYNTSLNNMNDTYRADGHLPLNQPYNIPPWNYPGPEVVSPTELMPPGPNPVVDWILVAHIDTSGVDTVFTYRAALLRQNGAVTDVAGQQLRLPVTKPGFIAVFHRNHLAIMSDKEIVFDLLPTTVNFIDGSTPAIGGPFAMNTNAGVNLMISGDANRDGVVNSVDKNLEWALQNGTAFDYFLSTADFNFDAFINAVDKNLYYSPNNSKQSQCPFCY